MLENSISATIGWASCSYLFCVFPASCTTFTNRDLIDFPDRHV